MTGRKAYQGPGADQIAALRRALLIQAQVGRKALAIEEEDWRALLERETGERSTRAMDHVQLGRVCKALEALGHVPQAHGGGGRWRPVAKHAHHRKVYALWGALKRAGVWQVSDVASLNAFCRRVAQVDAVEWLNPHQATKVIEALSAMAERAGLSFKK